MRNDPFSPLALCLLSSLAAAATTTVNLVIPPTHLLPNPRSLPPSTHATLSSFHFDASAYLSPANTFTFHNVSEGSYLLDVHSPSHAFAPLRVDILPVVSGAGQTEKEERTAKLKVAAWETYRGNDWNNKGEAAVVTNSGAVEVKVLGPKNFYMERSSCKWCHEGSAVAVSGANAALPVNVLSILKSPMILLGLVSMGIFFGMPYLVDNSEYLSVVA
jgi:ER membrane protein complex subunit 7